MVWLSQNWIWLLFFAGFITMHLLGHGGMVGGHKDADEGGPARKTRRVIVID